MSNDKQETSSAAETVEVQIQACRDSIKNVMGRDRYRLQRQLKDIAGKLKAGKRVDQPIAKLMTAIERSVRLRQQREQSVPDITFPDALPVSGRRDEISELIRDNQVVILAGETGSGKTTQLPKICLQLGRGIDGVIGHTQPRRIAARTVASRIADELNTPLGESVGYQVRFSDHSSETSHIKLMTDGILLAEIQHDRYLNKYDTLIIDEAHERSLNIDFLLGYLKQLLPRRPDLKVIITSATIDVDRFSKHFNDAPVIEVSGRTYPVDVHYRPTADSDDDLYTAITDTVEEILQSEKDSARRGGDILVFLSGERDIRETALALRKAEFPHLEVLPLYARLGLAEQNKVFDHQQERKVTLSSTVEKSTAPKMVLRKRKRKKR